MAITRLTKHDSCEVTIRRTVLSGPHYAELRCVDCDKHIQWLNQTAYEILAGKHNNKEKQANVR